MPKRKSATPILRPKQNNGNDLDQFEINEHEDHVEMIYVPDPDDSGESDTEDNVDPSEFQS